MSSTRHSIRELVMCALFSALIAVGAFIKISIPLDPFPMHFTLQFFFVLLAGFLLGSTRGLLSVGVYLILGLVGIPVFAAGGGIAYVLRPTFGFLLGFALAAYVTGLIARKAPRQRYGWLLLAALAGMMAYYICGMVYFYVISNYVIHMPVTWPVVFVNCFLITVAGDAVLCVLAALLARRLRPEMSRIMAYKK